MPYKISTFVTDSALVSKRTIKSRLRDRNAGLAIVKMRSSLLSVTLRAAEVFYDLCQPHYVYVIIRALNRTTTARMKKTHDIFAVVLCAPCFLYIFLCGCFFIMGYVFFSEHRYRIYVYCIYGQIMYHMRTQYSNFQESYANSFCACRINTTRQKKNVRYRFFPHSFAFCALRRLIALERKNISCS